jgi:hypothetical protein
VKWVNQQGGIDYWMFSRRQLFKREVSNVEIFSPVVTDSETAKGFSQILGVDGIEKVTVGAENITSNEYESISKLIYSPKIEWFNEKLQKWQTLIIDKGDNDNDTKATLKELDFTFKLPDPQLQF